MVRRDWKIAGEISHLQRLEPSSGLTMTVDIQPDRIMRELAELATFSNASLPAVTRVVFSAQDLAARAWFKRLCVERALTVREDSVGNTFARWAGADPDLPAVATGSHMDAIPNAGRFDGTVGVLGGLEAIRTLRSNGFQPWRSIELILFTSEEPTRFGVGCVGSRLLSGSLSAKVADQMKDEDGGTLAEIRERAGFRGDLESVRLNPDFYSGFVELHIEQGPILEREQINIGVVSHIAAPAALRIEIEGEGGHAGAVLMPQRRDAFSAAAELALAIESAARRTGSIDTVATTGTCNVFPAAINSIPSKVQLGVDVRDVDLERRDSILHTVDKAAKRISADRHVDISINVITADAPAVSDERICTTIRCACQELGLTYRNMVSRAYHDCLFMSRICPASMIFIPCRNGVSHRPDEYASEEDIVNGVRVLARTLAQLAQ
ncbi:MAG TPA: M20 family metallo-hydrolase [Bryobacteraceae bacterium]|nr:M20 family metallo-hydrolase [Bryobacteraceae bacterium]